MFDLENKYNRYNALSSSVKYLGNKLNWREQIGITALKPFESEASEEEPLPQSRVYDPTSRPTSSLLALQSHPSDNNTCSDLLDSNIEKYRIKPQVLQVNNYTLSA